MDANGWRPSIGEVCLVPVIVINNDYCSACAKVKFIGDYLHQENVVRLDELVPLPPPPAQEGK